MCKVYHIPHLYRKFSSHTKFYVSTNILKTFRPYGPNCPKFTLTLPQKLGEKNVIVRKSYHIPHLYHKLSQHTEFHVSKPFYTFGTNWTKFTQISSLGSLFCKNSFTFDIFILNLVHMPNFIFIRPF